MSTRTYLSIGDVLTLLREEFPDVTISKIRFLESQGLVNPERSPSGYRKFFDHDVERLRWVLRQQREHFLPLKVIRDRLADGDLGEDLGPEQSNGKEALPAHAVAVSGVASGHAQEQPTKADEEAMARILADASRRTARLPEERQARPGLQVVTEADPAQRVAPEATAPRAGEPKAPRRAAAERPGTTAATVGSRHAAPPPPPPPPPPTGRVNGASLPRQPEAAVTPPTPPPPADARPRKGEPAGGRDHGSERHHRHGHRSESVG